MTRSPAPYIPLSPTREMIEAGAQRLVRWETDNEKWPGSWSELDVSAARNDAERCWRSMWLAAHDGPPITTDEEPPTLPSAERCDRGDAVNLAYNTRDDGTYDRVSPKGVRVLVDAVLRMDEYIRNAAPHSVSAPTGELDGAPARGRNTAGGESSSGHAVAAPLSSTRATDALAITLEAIDRMLASTEEDIEAERGTAAALAFLQGEAKGYRGAAMYLRAAVARFASTNDPADSGGDK